MTKKECYQVFQQIRSIIEDPGRDSKKLDQIHRVADFAVNDLQDDEEIINN